MVPMHVRLEVTLVCVMLSTSIVSAQQAGSPVKAARPTVNAAAQRPGREARSLVDGLAVTSDRLPLRNARVRLRNLDTNQIEQMATSNERGEFSFVARPDVSYVVEITDQAGRVVAVGDVILVKAGEVAGAVIPVPSNVPLAGMFGDTASSVIATATSLGMTVVDPTLPKVSPRE